LTAVASYSRVVYINSELSADVTPQGWNEWSKVDGKRRPTTPSSIAQAQAPIRRRACPGRINSRRRKARQFKPKVFLAGKDRWDAEAEAAKLP